jgi:hypothetical protein
VKGKKKALKKRIWKENGKDVGTLASTQKHLTGRKSKSKIQF